MTAVLVSEQTAIGVWAWETVPRLFESHSATMGTWRQVSVLVVVVWVDRLPLPSVCKYRR
jgi:tellurite resistance-related uncharacterized protein